MSYSEENGQVKTEPAPDYPGYHYEWQVDKNWRMGGDGRKCRMKGCHNLAVASFLRARIYRGERRSARWHYCEAHLYGRRIQDGVVKHRTLVEDMPAVKS